MRRVYGEYVMMKPGLTALNLSMVVVVVTKMPPNGCGRSELGGAPSRPKRPTFSAARVSSRASESGATPVAAISEASATYHGPDMWPAFSCCACRRGTASQVVMTWLSKRPRVVSHSSSGAGALPLDGCWEDGVSSASSSVWPGRRGEKIRRNKEGEGMVLASGRKVLGLDVVSVYVRMWGSRCRCRWIVGKLAGEAAIRWLPDGRTA